MRLIYPLTQWAIVLCFRIYFRMSIRGKQHVPKTGRVLLASTHASNLDPMLVGAPLSRLSNYLARRTLFEPKWWGGVLKKYGAIPLEREGVGTAAMRAVLELLKLDRCVVIFPEGTRSPDGELQPLKGGVGLLARKTQAPVVPVAIVGNERALKKGSPIPRPVRIALRYGEPIEIGADESEEEFLARLRTCFEELRALAFRDVGIEKNRTATAA